MCVKNIKKKKKHEIQQLNFQNLHPIKRYKRILNDFSLN